MSHHIHAIDFGISVDNIPAEIKELYLSFSELRRTMLDKSYGSGLDFITILYHLRFVQKLENSEIAERLGMKPPTIHIKLYDFSWHYSSDWDDNKAKVFDEMKRNKEVLLLAKAESIKLDINTLEHNRLCKALSSSIGIDENTYLGIGLATREEYIRTLYFLKFVKHYSVKQLIPIFKQSHGTMQDQLRRLGLGVTHDEGMAQKKARGSQDYGKTIRTGKKVTTKAQLTHYTDGSKNQDYVRTQLSRYIYDDGYFDSNQYDVVVGVSNTGVLGALEIDIPVIVYDIKTQYTHRFAIEYNGNYFHSKERDLDKKSKAEARGWHYLSIEENSSAGFSNNQEKLHPLIHQLCRQINDIIKSDMKKI